MIRGIKRDSFLQKSTLCFIMIWRKIYREETNCSIFVSHIKIYNLHIYKKKFAIGLENNLMAIYIQFQADNIVKRFI